jgi:DNA gyrase subunit B
VGDSIHFIIKRLRGWRTLPLLLLLAATSDLLDTSDYIEMTEARNNVGAYLGNSGDEYDPHHLLWAVVENSILEFKAGYCTEATIILQRNGSVTVADNGRGIPVSAISEAGTSPVKAVFTEMSRFNRSAPFLVSGAELGIKIPIVNALSDWLSVEIRREGKQFRQDFRHGIPHTELLMVGVTKETGTSVTFKPSADIFRPHFDSKMISNQAADMIAAYPGLRLDVIVEEEDL